MTKVTLERVQIKKFVDFLYLKYRNLFCIFIFFLSFFLSLETEKNPKRYLEFTVRISSMPEIIRHFSEKEKIPDCISKIYEGCL